MERWFLIYSFGFSNPQLQQATGVGRHTMRKRDNIFILLLFLTISINLRGQNINQIVNKIAKINQVEFYGQSGKLENFKNFELLKKKSKVNELLLLIDHKNLSVVCYSSFGLIDKKYNKIDKILAKLLEQKNKVTTLGGCLLDEQELSELFYDYFNFNSKLSETEKNKFTSKLDSIAINSGKSEVLIHKILNEKKLSDNYNKQIKLLAYKDLNVDALLYISKWKIEIDNEKLKNNWINYIDKTELHREYFGFDYETIKKLLEMKDVRINNKVLLKLINFKSEQEKERIEEILSKYNMKIN